MEKNIKDMFGKYNADELGKYLSEQLEKTALKSEESKNEFMRFLASFKSDRYSARNQCMLYVQASVKEYMPIFGTYDEWKAKGTSIKKGEKGMTICRPIFSDVYYTKAEEGQIPERHVKFALSEEKVKEYEELVKKGEMTRVSELTSFIYVDSAFSMSQTTMQEHQRIEYLQRYNNFAVDTEEHLHHYEQLKAIASEIGRPVEEQQIKGEALGWVEKKDNGKIVIKADMPVDAKVSVLAHEIGHKILHIQNNTAELRPQKEVQAQLFSHIAMLKLGVDAEKQFSLNYINNWSSDKFPPMFDANGNELKKSEILQYNLSVVIPAVNSLMEVVDAPEGQLLNAEALERLKNYKDNTEKPEQKKGYVQKEKETKVEIEPLRVVKQTDKAVMVKTALNEQNPEEPKRSIWLPKSQITIDNGLVTEATPAVIKEKGLTPKANLTSSKTATAGRQRSLIRK